MTTYSAINPLPMRIPATNPPVAGDHIDIGVWPGGWQFMTASDRARFERLPEEGEMSKPVFLDMCEQQAQALEPREDTSEDLCTDHGFDVCPDCGNAGTKIGPDGYEPCTRFLRCWSDA